MTEGSVIGELLIVLLLVLLNGFFAMSELAIVSARRTRLKHLADEGNRGARTALRLAEEPTQFLSTVQIGITLVGIVAGAYSGATLSEPLATKLRQIPLLEPYAYPAAVSIVVAGITYLSLVIGELVPKRIAMRHAVGIAIRVSRPMSLLAKIGGPIVALLRISTDGILRLMGVKPDTDDHLTEEEIKTVIAEGKESGVLIAEEQEMIEGVLRLADQTVRAVMTPRPDIDWVDANDTPELMLQQVLESHHSRLPFCEGEVDEVLGIVRAKDLLAQLAEQSRIDPKACLIQPLIVHDTTTILRLLEMFRKGTVHIALVLDEYGSLQGLVTPTDIFTAIAGALPEADHTDPSIVERPDGSYLIDGRTKVVELERILDIDDLLEEDYSTMAGLVLYRLGHIPRVGERFEWEGYRFEVMDMDGRRIDRVLVTPLEIEEETD